MKVIHSPACRRKISEWYGEPRDSVKRNLASFAYSHNDTEIRDLLLTILADDPPDSDAVAAARELWPLLLLSDPLYTPEELADDLAVLIRDHEMMVLRTQALAAKYRSLEPWASMWDRYPHDDPEFGELNIDNAVLDLGSFASMAGDYQREQLAKARKSAAKVRVYDDAEVQS
ncbi:hypothetical protein [Nocardia australiensis]|uniref:hypothetical protein n=1 Tax=Nocardia australiensis TaxID=2887191 RepID=UPI001D140C6E|nr:hypothetical protein [Nocardia australiensis]